jgi:hypothetical protein
MLFAPLRESVTFAVKVLEKYRHTHADIPHRETATVGVRNCANEIGDIGVSDENGGFVAPRLQKLRRISDIDQTLPRRFFRNVAMRGRQRQISMKKCEDVRVVILDGLSA